MISDATISIASPATRLALRSPVQVAERDLPPGAASIPDSMAELGLVAFVLIAADSGVGKSSLCRAGVLPLIADGALGGSRAYAIASMVPGRKPLSALCAAVAAALSCDEAALQTDLEQRPDSFARTLRKLLSTGRGLFLFLDQMEELVTLASPEEARIVGEALGSLLAKLPGLRLLLTARSDFLGRIATVPGIGAMPICTPARLRITALSTRAERRSNRSGKFDNGSRITGISARANSSATCQASAPP